MVTVGGSGVVDVRSRVRNTNESSFLERLTKGVTCLKARAVESEF